MPLLETGRIYHQPDGYLLAGDLVTLQWHNRGYVVP